MKRKRRTRHTQFDSSAKPPSNAKYAKNTLLSIKRRITSEKVKSGTLAFLDTLCYAVAMSSPYGVLAMQCPGCMMIQTSVQHDYQRQCLDEHGTGDHGGEGEYHPLLML